MGVWGSKSIEITIPSELLPFAGNTKTVSCRPLGGGRIHKIDTNMLNEYLGSFGESKTFLEVTREAEKRESGVKERQASDDRSPLEKAFAKHPAHLVCQYCIRSVNGEKLGSAEVTEWVDDTSPKIQEFIAGELLKKAGLIEETSAQKGEGSGGS